MSQWKIKPEIPLYFITSTTVKWQPVFTEIPLFETIMESWRYCCANKNLHLHGYVVMPNHIHAIVSSNEVNHLSDILRDLNRYTSQRITALLEELKRDALLAIFHQAAQEENRGNQYKVWQEGFHPIAIESGEFFQQKLEYIHQNPVRKGYVEHAEHWRYSSARNYLLNDHSIIQIEQLG
jgi:putative transposase